MYDGVFINPLFDDYTNSNQMGGRSISIQNAGEDSQEYTDIFYAGSSYFSIKSRSTGLGLIIAQDLTRWLGGEVKILHTGPSGTVLRVAIRNIAPEPVESGGASDIVDYASVTDYKEPS